MDEFEKSLSKPEDINVAYDTNNRLEYNELTHEELDRLLLLSSHPDSMVDIACGPAKTLIYFYNNSNMTNIFGCEIVESRYNMGVENILKLRQNIQCLDNGLSAKFTQYSDHVTLSVKSVRKITRTITYYHMSMYNLPNKIIKDSDIIIANVGYFYRMRHKYKDIFKIIKKDVKILSYKGPIFTKDQIKIVGSTL